MKIKKLYTFLLLLILTSFTWGDSSKYDISHLSIKETGKYVNGSLDETDVTPKTGWCPYKLDKSGNII